MKKAIVPLMTLLGAVAVWGVSPSARAQNLLTNGSFETSTTPQCSTSCAAIPGWTSGGNFTYTWVQSGSYEGFYSSYSAQSGSNFVVFGPVGTDGTLSQTFSDTAGGTLNVSGWLQGDGTTPSDWSMSLDGTSYVSVNPVPDQGWTRYSFTAPATGSDTFSISFSNTNDYSAMDNFSVTEGTATVPEPSTLALFGVGAIGLLLALRRRSRAQD